MRLRAGVIGCGRIGCMFDEDPLRESVSTHAGAYTRSAGVELVALADPDDARLRSCADRYGVEHLYPDHLEMLAHERLDVVSVCTRGDMHRTIAEAAADAGVRVVFCEKPIAGRLEDADEMIHHCADRGTLLLVDHQRRFDPFHREVAAFLAGGGLGSIQQVTAYYTAGVANTGSHMFDLLRWFFGEIAWVQGMHSLAPSHDDRDPNIDGFIQFVGGARAALQACDVASYTIFEINALGTLGRLRILSHGFDMRFELAVDSPRFSGYRELVPAEPPIAPEGPREFMLQAIAHVVDCLEREIEPWSSGEDGRAALEVVCALRESAESGGRRVDLPLARSDVMVWSR